MVRSGVTKPEDTARASVAALAREAATLVERTPGVMGGAACIAGTRVDVFSLVSLRRAGWSVEQMHEDAYPHLTLGTIFGALAWADEHPDEIARDERDSDREFTAALASLPVEPEATPPVLVVRHACPGCGASTAEPTCGACSPIVDQPPPAPSAGCEVWPLVVADMLARDHVGRARYGTPLRAGNGRDALIDAYQEALDLAVYLRQAIEERGR